MSTKLDPVDEWSEQYKPVTNHITKDSSWNGILFETYSPDIDYVVAVANSDPDKVWTWVDGDDGTYIVNGYQMVNRIGYFITELPFENDPAYDPYVEIEVDKYEDLSDWQEENYVDSVYRSI